MAAEVDPISQIYTGLWAVLNASTAFKAAFKPKNQIRFDTEVRAPDKKEILPADFPEVRIIPMRGVVKLICSSSSTFIHKFYQIQVASGDLRANDYLHPVEFITIAAISAWQPILMPLTWKGKPFVKMLRLDDFPEGMRQSDLQRNIRGWSTMVNLSIETYFTTTDLQTLQASDLLGAWSTGI